MSTETLLEFANRNEALLDVAVNDDALFVCTLIAQNGYTQTAELPHELEASSRHIRSTLRRLVRADFIAHQVRSDGIFNGWVATAAGYEFLETLGLIDKLDHKEHVFDDIINEVANALDAQRRHGCDAPTVEQVAAVVRRVPKDRQEWLGFAICFEPISGDDLDTLLNPTPDQFGRLRRPSLDEIKTIPAEDWQNWASKHGVEKTVDQTSWAKLQQ